MGGNTFHGYVYDGIWTLAVALDQLVADYTETFGARRLNTNDINATWFQNSFLQALNRTAFEGMTVSVHFVFLRKPTVYLQ